MNAKRIVRRHTWKSSYKFTNWHVEPGYEYAMCGYRHPRLGYVRVYSDRGCVKVWAVVGSREFCVTAEPGCGIRKKSIQSVVARVLIPELERHIKEYSK